VPDTWWSSDLASTVRGVTAGKATHADIHAGLLGMALMWGASWPAGRVLAQAMPPLSGSAVMVRPCRPA